MAPVVIPGTLQIQLIWNLGTAFLGMNVLNALIGAGPTVDQTMSNAIADLAEAAHTGSPLATLQPTTVTLASTRIRDIRTANNPQLETLIGSAGTSTADLLPRGNALVVTSRTARAGGSFRGRTYVPGFSESAAGADGRASATAMTAASEFLTNFQNSMGSNAWPLAVASTKLAVSTPITIFVTRNNVWDRQWRRATRGVPS